MIAPAALLHCPACAKPLEPVIVPKAPPTAFKYEDCLRRCDGCGVGYSNAKSKPTLIYQNPLLNLPAESRKGIELAIDESLNKQSRSTKWRRLGFSTSEDAVTWVVFSFLSIHGKSALVRLGQNLFGLSGAGEPQVLLWGSPVPIQQDAIDLRKRLIAILDGLGENRDRRSEPDVILDYGPAGLIFIEVKLNAKNDKMPSAGDAKFARYVAKTPAFANRALAIKSGLYELTRNWRIGWDLAGDRPFRLVNLGKPQLFDKVDSLDLFEDSLAVSTKRGFLRVKWGALLETVRLELGELPPWLTQWLNERGFSPAAE
jgi:hypothetical protein